MGRRARHVACIGWHRRREFFADFAEVDQPQVLVTTLISLISLISPRLMTYTANELGCVQVSKGDGVAIHCQPMLRLAVFTE